MSLIDTAIPTADVFPSGGNGHSGAGSAGYGDAARLSDDAEQCADEWRIRCHDVVSRDRCLTVLVDKGRVLLVGPPGETAVLTNEQLSQLRNALEEAAVQVER